MNPRPPKRPNSIGRRATNALLRSHWRWRVKIGYGKAVMRQFLAQQRTKTEKRS